MNKNRLHSQQGFTLIEIVISVVILSILSALAIIGYKAVVKSHHEADVKLRLLQVYEAEMRFRSTRRLNRFGALCSELKTSQTSVGSLIPDGVAQFSADCATPVAVNEWTISDGLTAAPNATQIETLRSQFIIHARRSGSSTGDVEYCIAEDGVVRRGASCSRNSPRVE